MQPHPVAQLNHPSKAVVLLPVVVRRFGRRRIYLFAYLN